MSQRYDTGLSTSQRTAIRAAVVARLAPLLKSNGGYLRAVKALARPYRGAGDDDGLVIVNMSLQGQMPAALVTLGRKTYGPLGMDRENMLGELELAVYVASANPRALDDGRLAPDVTSAASDSADPGIETMLEHVEQLLLGQDLGIDGVAELMPVHEDEVFTGPEFSLYEIRFTVAVDRLIDVARAAREISSIQVTTTLDDGIDAPTDLITTITQLEAP